MTRLLTWIFFSAFMMTSFQGQTSGFDEDLQWEGYQRKQDRRLTHALAQMGLRNNAADRAVTKEELELERRRVALEERRYADAQEEKKKEAKKVSQQKEKLVEDNKSASSFLSSWRRALEADSLCLDGDQFIRTQVAHALHATRVEGKDMSSKIFTPETLRQIIQRKTQADSVMEKARAGLSKGVYDYVPTYKQDLEQRLKRGYAGFGWRFIEDFQKLDEEHRKESEGKRQENIRRIRLEKERKAREEKEKAERLKREKAEQQKAKERALNDEILRREKELEEHRVRAMEETGMSREELDRRVREKRSQKKRNEEALEFLRPWHEDCKARSRRVDRFLIEADAAAIEARKQGSLLSEELVEKLLKRKKRADEAMNHVKEDLSRGKFRTDPAYESQMRERVDLGYVGFSERFVAEVLEAKREEESRRGVHRSTHHHRQHMTPQQVVDAALEIVGPAHGSLSMTSRQKDFYGTFQLEGYEITDEVLSLAKAVLAEANS